jgi:hypothetical protein
MILQSQSRNPYKKRRKRNVKTVSQSNKNKHTPLHLPKCPVLCFRQVQSRHFTILQSPSHNAYKKEEKETLEPFLNQIKTKTRLCTYLNVRFCAFVKSKAGISRSCKVQAIMPTKKKEKKR